MKLTNLDRTFPIAKYKMYLEEFGADDQNLDVKNIEQIFIVMRSDFIKGNLDLDDFALICNSLYSVMTKKHFDDDNLALANVLDGVNELSFDIRTDKEEILKFLPDRIRLIFNYKPEFERSIYSSSADSKDIKN